MAKRTTRKDTAPKTRKRRADGWGNALTGLGKLNIDKRLGASYLADVLGAEEAKELWRGNDLAARIIETPVNEMLRQGWELCITDEKDLAETIMGKAEDLKAAEAFWQALSYRRGLGGGAILMGIDDGARSLAQPVNLNNVRGVMWLTVLEPSELKPYKYYANPLAAKFGQPATYLLNPYSPGLAYESTSPVTNVEVHESRLIIFQGTSVSRTLTNANGGWGDSVLTRCNPVLRDYGTSWDAAVILLVDFSQAVYKVKGLAEMMGLDRDDEFRARVRAVETSRSVAHAVFIDAEEEFERKSTQLTGLPDMLDRLATRLAAAADMPLTLLMGQSPAGLNATGESDIRFFYDRMKAAQDRDLRPPLEYFYKLLLLAELQGGEPDDWNVKFNPLWQPTEKEQAETRKLQMEVDTGYVNAQVVSPEEVAKSRFGGDSYSFETQLDWELREQLDGPINPHLLPPPPDEQFGEEDEEEVDEDVES